MRLILYSMCFAEYIVPLGNVLAGQNTVSMVLGRENVATALGIPIDRLLTKEINYLSLPHIRKNRPFQIAGSILSAAKAIRHFHPDVIHLQDSFDPVAACLIPFFGRVPVVVEIHDPSAHPGDHSQKRFRFRFPSSLLRRRADALIAHGEYCRNLILPETNLPAERVYSIPLGGVSILKKQDEKGSIKEEPHSILFFGRMREYKGLQYLVQAEPLISKKIPDLKIILAGSGPELTRCKSMMGNPERFEVHDGFVASMEMVQLFRRASIVVVPYIEASQSAVITSAFTFGKPVVATTVGGIPDVVDNGVEGYLVPPFDSKSLAIAIIDLLENENKRASMGQAALLKAEGPLSWKSIGDQVSRVYMDLLR